MVLSAGVRGHGGHLGYAGDEADHEEPDGDGGPDDAGGAAVEEAGPVGEEGAFPRGLEDGDETDDADEFEVALAMVSKGWSWHSLVWDDGRDSAYTKFLLSAHAGHVLRIWIACQSVCWRDACTKLTRLRSHLALCHPSCPPASAPPHCHCGRAARARSGWNLCCSPWPRDRSPSLPNGHVQWWWRAKKKKRKKWRRDEQTKGASGTRVGLRMHNHDQSFAQVGWDSSREGSKVKLNRGRFGRAACGGTSKKDSQFSRVAVRPTRADASLARGRCSPPPADRRFDSTLQTRALGAGLGAEASALRVECNTEARNGNRDEDGASARPLRGSQCHVHARRWRGKVGRGGA